MPFKTIFPTGDYSIYAIDSVSNPGGAIVINRQVPPDWTSNDGVPYISSGVITNFWEYLNDSTSSTFLMKSVNSSVNLPSGVQSVNNGPSGVSHNGVGFNYWDNMTNAFSLDGSQTTSVGDAPAIRFDDFNIDLPSNAETVTGIRFAVYCSGDGTAVDDTVRIIKNNGVQGDNKAAVGNWTAGVHERVYGGPTDLWGIPSGNWIINDVESNDFGLYFKPSGTDLGIDYVDVRVYYTTTTSGTSFGQSTRALLQFETDIIENLSVESVNVNIKFSAEKNASLYCGDLGPTSGNIQLLDTTGRRIAYFEADDSTYLDALGNGFGTNMALASSGVETSISIPLTIDSGNLPLIDYYSKCILSLPISIDPSEIPEADEELLKIYDVDVEISGFLFSRKPINLFVSTYAVGVPGSQLMFPIGDVDSDGPWQKVPSTTYKYQTVNEGVQFDNGFTNYLRNTGGAGINFLEFTTFRPRYFPISGDNGEIKFSMSTYMDYVASGALPIEVTAIEFSQNGNTLAYKYADSTVPGVGEGLYQINPDGYRNFMDITLIIPSGAEDLVNNVDLTTMRIQFYDPNTFFHDWQIGSVQFAIRGTYLTNLTDNNVEMFVWGHDTYRTHGLEDSSFDNSYGDDFGKSNSLRLYTYGEGTESGVVDLYTHGVGARGYLDMFVEGFDVKSSGIDLSIVGHLTESGNIDLFTSGANRSSNSFNMYISGPVLHSSDASVSMFTWGTNNNGLFKDINLFVQSFDDPTHYNSLNMTAFGYGTFDATNSLNLFVKSIGNDDGSIDYSDSINMVAYNTVQSFDSSVNMFTQGSGNTDGAVPYNNSLNLFIHRGEDSTANNITMFVSGPAEYSGTINLFLDGQPSAESGIDLFTAGYYPSGDSITLYTNGF